MRLKNMRLKKSVSILFGTAILASGLAFSSAASAQVTQAYQDTQAYNGPTITFEQVYANPDNQDLNLNYARQQAAAGDYLTAASTLERMLYTSPNWDSARLFYAMVLYRLDDSQAAVRELDLLDGRPLSAGQRAQVAAYRNNFNKPQSRSTSSGFKGRIAVGARYDDNAGNALADTLFTFANRDDTSFFAQGSLKYTAPIGDNGLKFKAGINGQVRRHETFSTADYDTFGANAGLVGDLSDSMSWTASVQASQVNISGQKYLTQIGGRLSLRKAVSEQVGVWVRGTWHDQDYSNLSFTTIEPTRSGDKTSITAGIIKRFNQNSFVGASVGYEDKKATNAAFAYDGLRLNGRFYNGFDNGIYMKARATYRMLKYDGTSFNNPGPTRREDDHLSAHVGLGASISTISSVLGMGENPSMENLSLETGINYTNRKSNNTVLEYKNFGGEIKLIWDF